MLVAAPVDQQREVVVGLADATEIVLWDSLSGQEEYKASPALTLPGGRRLAVLEALLGWQADVVCSVPQGFCAASYALASASALRFLPLEVGTPVRLVREHLVALARAAAAELPATWLAGPDLAATREAIAPDEALALSDAAAKALVNRLKRLEGQARGVQRLIEERRDYETVLTQVAAMRSALNAIGLTLLAEHLAVCLARAAVEPTGRQSVEAAKRAFQRLN